MGSSVTVYLSRPLVERATSLLESGEFDTLSELCRYSIRFFLDWIESENVQTLTYVRRTDPVKRNIQLNDEVVGRILGRGLINRADIADYALSHYLEFKGL